MWNKELAALLQEQFGATLPEQGVGWNEFLSLWVQHQFGLTLPEKHYLLLQVLIAIFGLVLVAYRLTAPKKGSRPEKLSITEPRWVRWVLIGVALTFLLLFLVLP